MTVRPAQVYPSADVVIPLHRRAYTFSIVCPGVYAILPIRPAVAPDDLCYHYIPVQKFAPRRSTRVRTWSLSIASGTPLPCGSIILAIILASKTTPYSYCPHALTTPYSYCPHALPYSLLILSPRSDSSLLILSHALPYSYCPML